MADDGKQVQPTAEVGEAGEKAAPKKKKKLIVAGVAAAIVVVAGIGFFVWHEQPSFCNAICHQPMDKYVETYYAEDGNGLAAAHAKAGSTCLDCHEPTLGQQISEGITWVTGNFYMTEDGYIYHAEEREPIGTKQFCFECHDDGDASTGKDWAEVVASTANYGGEEGFNVHENHMSTNFDCGDCHSVHATSFMSCNDGCHDLVVPQGWEGGGIL